MTKYLYLSAALLLIAASQQCLAMEAQNETQNIIPAKILAKITAIKEPQSVICFPNNIVAIAGKDGCNVCEFSPNKKNINLSNFPTHYQRIIAHPNKKLLAFYSNNSKESDIKLAIYDIATTKKLWDTTTELFGHPVFIPTTNEIVTCSARSDLQTFDYTTNSPIQPRMLDLPGNRSFYTSHPKERELLFVTDYNCEQAKKICTITISQPTKWRRLAFPIQENVFGCKYSPDGSLIALNHGIYGCSIFDPKTGSCKLLAEDRADNHTFTPYSFRPYCAAMVFHPTMPILATISLGCGTIYYWNFIIQKLIAKTKLTASEEECNFNVPGYPFNQRLDFSWDGIRLIVALNDKCLILEVPFKIFKDKCIFTYWLLKNYQHNQISHTIPNDIIDLLMHNLLETSNFQFTNH